jgi:hypothetical protein
MSRLKWQDDTRYYVPLFNYQYTCFTLSQPTLRFHGTPITGRVLTICQPRTAFAAAEPPIFRRPHTLRSLQGRHPLVDERCPALTLRTFATKQTLVIADEEPRRNVKAFIASCAASSNFFLLSLRRACRFQLHCGIETLEIHVKVFNWCNDTHTLHVRRDSSI